MGSPSSSRLPGRFVPRMANLISAILSALAPVFHNPSTICPIVHRLVALRVSRGPSWTVSVHDHGRCSLSHAAGHPGDVATDHVWRVRCTRRDLVRGVRVRNGPGHLSGRSQTGLPHTLSGGWVTHRTGCGAD